MQTRREFIKTSMASTGGLMLGGLALDAKIYARSKQANGGAIGGSLPTRDGSSSEPRDAAPPCEGTANTGDRKGRPYDRTRTSSAPV